MFCHEKLDVYQKAVKFLGAMHKVIRGLPPGNSDVINQLRRAVMSISLNLAEGAGKTGKADKQRFYAIARGSALECAAILDVLCIWELISADKLKDERALLEQIVAMASALALK